MLNDISKLFAENFSSIISRANPNAVKQVKIALLKLSTAFDFDSD